ncbi:hypothetical protein [Pontibacter sp. SGAir0037]|uniref:hypothetical protein n=1 Tax=Pontibacter sp. SGAir0037 TaxID=2571030 RepID=UPI0010CD052E|nr:hypothetical protein [Pontibacter sp. SGAir0037]QCR21700.1 hypothetical protein C1N53_04630 [Pontibacter sp. SGAir0037]
MNKNILLLLSFLLFIPVAYAQDDPQIIESTNTDQNITGDKPQKFGIAFQLNSLNYDDIKVGWFNSHNGSLDDHTLEQNSLSAGVIGYYNVSDETSLRLRLGATRISLKEYYDFTDDQGINSDFAATGIQTRVCIAPGVAWKFTQNKLQFYAGFEFPVTLHGEFALTESRIQYETGQSAMVAHTILRTVLPSGFSAGVGALGGFNYFLNKTFSVGAEFSSALLYAKLSGETTATLSTIKPENTSPVIINTQDGNKGVTFNDSRFSIGIAFWFSSNKPVEQE